MKRVPLIVTAAVALSLTAAGCSTTTSTTTSSAAPSGSGSNSSSKVGTPTPNPASPLYARVVKNAAITVDTTKWKKPGPYHIAALTEGPINGWGSLFDAQLKAAAKSNSQVKQLTLLPDQGNVETEVNDFQQVLSEKPDAILLVPQSVSALSATATRAEAAGIPVITCADRSTGSGWVTEVGQKLYAQGFEAAVQLAQMMHGQGNVVILDGIPGVDSGDAWKAGGHDALSHYPGIHIVAEQPGNWSTATGKQVTTTMLSAHSKIDGVLTYGMAMGMGALEAFHQAGRPIPPIAGVGMINGFARLALAYGVKQWWASAFDPSISKVCLDTVVDVLHGKPVRKFIDGLALMPGVKVFSNKNAKQIYKPALNDQIQLGPTFMSLQQLKAAGFGR